MTVDVSTRALRAAAAVIACRRLAVVVEGREHVPTTGPVLIVARHVHHLHDGVALLTSVPRPLRIMVALDWVRRPAGRRLMEVATGLARWPVVLRGEALVHGPDGRPRNTGGAYRRAEAPAYHLRGMRSGLRLLTAGQALAIFPEGYPNIDPGWTPKCGDEMLPFQPGFASLALMARDHRHLDVPIVPTGMQFRRSSASRWAVTVRFGQPMTLGARGTPAVVIAEAERRVAALSDVPEPRAATTSTARLVPRASRVASG